MRDFFVSLWTNESRFIGIMRGAIMLAAELIRSDYIPMGAHGVKIAAVLMVIAVTIPAGDKNLPTGTA